MRKSPRAWRPIARHQRDLRQGNDTHRWSRASRLDPGLHRTLLRAFTIIISLEVDPRNLRCCVGSQSPRGQHRKQVDAWKLMWSRSEDLV